MRTEKGQAMIETLLAVTLLTAVFLGFADTLLTQWKNFQCEVAVFEYGHRRIRAETETSKGLPRHLLSTLSGTVSGSKIPGGFLAKAACGTRVYSQAFYTLEDWK